MRKEERQGGTTHPTWVSDEVAATSLLSTSLQKTFRACLINCFPHIAIHQGKTQLGTKIWAMSGINGDFLLLFPFFSLGDLLSYFIYLGLGLLKHGAFLVGSRGYQCEEYTHRILSGRCFLAFCTYFLFKSPFRDWVQGHLHGMR